MKHTIPSVLLAALLPAGLPAQDLPSQLVPADSKCVCYVDLAGLIDFVGRDLIREGIARKVRAEAGVKLKADWLAQLTKDWGFDPLVDLQGATQRQVHDESIAEAGRHLLLARRHLGPEVIVGDRGSVSVEHVARRQEATVGMGHPEAF